MRNECLEHGILFVVANQHAKSLTIENVKSLSYAAELEFIQDKLNQEGQINFNELAFLTHNVLMEDLKSWAAAHDLPFVDVIGSLDEHRDVLLSWVHLSPKGNQMIAEALAPGIIDSLALLPTTPF